MFSHIKKVPSREWSSDMIYGHLIPSDRSSKNKNKKGVNLTFKTYLGRRINK